MRTSFLTKCSDLKTLSLLLILWRTKRSSRQL
nr:MAG TPA: hypothetical protein [Bacteriophage sp.]